MQEEYDVFIAGAGIVACTFARILVDAGLNVIMVDAGSQHSRLPGENLKNFPNYQIDVDQFGGIAEGLMHPACIVPIKNQAEYTRNALNPKQDPAKNLPGAVVSYAVGGMAIHWTCAIPRHHETERISENILSAEELDKLYLEAETLLNLHTNVHSESLRHQVLKEVLSHHGFEDTPLAAERLNKNYVRYTGADTVLGDLAKPGQNKTLTILQEHRVTKLYYEGEDGGAKKVTSVLVRDLINGTDQVIKAKTFIVAAGWVHTAQILWHSGIQNNEDSALGRYLTEHTFTSCQVVLKESIVEEIGRRASASSNTAPTTGSSSLPIPMKDPPPHLHIPVTKERPWHAQLFREAFQFDPLIQTVDSRLIVDLKWFGMVEPVRTNRMKFEPDIMDRLGMPQPTFEVELSADDKKREDEMMSHMEEVARELGEYLPPSEPGKPFGPIRVPLGMSTHTMGATRMGDDEKTSVVDSHSKVWGFDNLYVGGNCVIPTANASNPTLTSVALAIRAAKHILSANTI